LIFDSDTVSETASDINFTVRPPTLRSPVRPGSPGSDNSGGENGGGSGGSGDGGDGYGDLGSPPRDGTFYHPSPPQSDKNDTSVSPTPPDSDIISTPDSPSVYMPPYSESDPDSVIAEIPYKSVVNTKGKKHVVSHSAIRYDQSSYTYSTSFIFYFLLNFILQS
jgi:hypothetical protein